MNGLRLFKGFFVVTLIAGGVFVWMRFGATNEKSTDQGNSGAVVRGDIVQRVTMIGTINSNKKLVVRAPYKGFVRKIFVKVGETVKVGSPLVSIAQSADQPDNEIFPLRSTMSGTVTQIQSSEGEAVNETGGEESFILRVDDLSRYTVACDTPEVDVIKLKPGQKTLVRASAINERQFEGEISTIALSSSVQDRWNRGVVQFRVEVGVKDAKANLLPGMTAMVDVIAAERKGVLTLGQEFVEPEGGKYYVNLTDGARIEIKVGLRDESSFEVLEGLVEGQSVKQVDFVAATKRNRGKM